MQEENKDVYMIPTNVTTRFEITSGIGWKEIGCIILAAVLGLILSLIIGLQTVPVEREIYVENGEVSDSMLQTKKGQYETIVKQESIISPAHRLLFLIVPAGFAFMMLKKNTSGQSALDILQNYYKYQRSQKRFEMKGGYYYDKIEQEAAKQKNRSHSEDGDS